jgi:predicted aspartyl protease
MVPDQQDTGISSFLLLSRVSCREERIVQTPTDNKKAMKMNNGKRIVSVVEIMEKGQSQDLRA